MSIIATTLEGIAEYVESVLVKIFNRPVKLKSGLSLVAVTKFLLGFFYNQFQTFKRLLKKVIADHARHGLLGLLGIVSKFFKISLKALIVLVKTLFVGYAESQRIVSAKEKNFFFKTGDISKIHNRFLIGDVGKVRMLVQSNSVIESKKSTYKNVSKVLLKIKNLIVNRKFLNILTMFTMTNIFGYVWWYFLNYSKIEY